jgi:hypothetical protein
MIEHRRQRDAFWIASLALAMTQGVVCEMTEPWQ